MIKIRQLIEKVALHGEGLFKQRSMNKKIKKLQETVKPQESIVPIDVQNRRNTILSKFYNNTPIEIEKRKLPTPKPIAGGYASFEK